MPSQFWEIIIAIITGIFGLLAVWLAKFLERRRKAPINLAWCIVIFLVVGGCVFALLKWNQAPACARLFLNQSRDAMVKLLQGEDRFLGTDENWIDRPKAQKDIIRRAARIKSKLTRLNDDIDRCHNAYPGTETYLYCKKATEFANSVQETWLAFQTLSTNLPAGKQALDAERTTLREQLKKTINFQEANNR